ncbi:glycosyltransferase family 2 protein [Pontibacter sp. SGAir0037]|uniref:glycosyltransferase family 2 protein n=1 Tax=Pontibacter sp. SGAir0037 TaxID=2571030 RepID=UPI0010CD4132|nr:glycosyltransferase family 2 protein [Pontibacter sp. SGAir0037]QCR23493.1 glycosyl transferase [Pontibacter sp. SGAir0037]
MKVSGFTFVRNAVKYDYPIIEAITSIIPLCDEVVVAVGNSDDGTLELIQSIASPKIRIIETVWDESLRIGGRVLAVETDKAYAAIAPDADWAVYIQGDEIMHEDYLNNVREAMLRYKDDPQVDGLLFKYRHFYGSYDYEGDATSWYRREIRVVRKRNDIYSYLDAQGFRKGQNQKLRVKLIDAYIHHYGWVREPRALQQKYENSRKFWHSDEWIEEHIVKAEQFDFSDIEPIKLFEGKHPAVMHERIARKNWSFSRDLSKKHYRFKDKFKLFVERLTGYRPFEYKNYKIV